MTPDPTHAEIRELREVSWSGIAFCVLGGFALLIWLIMFAVSLTVPPQNARPISGLLYSTFAAGIAILLWGIYLSKSGRIGIRLTASAFELPEFGASIPWTEIEEVRIEHLRRKGPIVSAPALIMMLTPVGRNLIGNRHIDTFPHADEIERRPDVCLRLNFASYGPDVETDAQLATDLRKRIAAASGGVDETPVLPRLDAPLELRDMSETGPMSRVYIHDQCGARTAISGSSLCWAANPLRYTSGDSVCAGCGVVPDSTLRWEDTGESLARFRRRMWQRTPLSLKVIQFGIVPALAGGIAAVAVAAMVPPAIHPAAAFGIGFVASNLLIWLTPLAGVIPDTAGLKYHEYR